VELQAQFVWLALTSELPRTAIAQDAARLASRLDQAGIQLVLGGRCSKRVQAAAGPSVHLFDTMAEMAGFATGLVAALRTRRKRSS
jgi:hypothetical protein